nr:MAG TPA: hypothetical protein [Caudoviricetes sp.]
MFSLYSKTSGRQEQNIMFFKNKKKVYKKHLLAVLSRKAVSGRHARHFLIAALLGKASIPERRQDYYEISSKRTRDFVIAH